MTIQGTSSTSVERALRARRSSAGFSLLEMLISMALLLVITGAVFEQIMVMQRSAAATGAKVDSEQQAREFVDQMVRDLHMAGYPKAAMYSATPDNTSPLVATGLVSVSPTQIILEGDVNSDGVVESVNVGYVGTPAGDPNCPCIRRSAVQKISGDPLAQPVSAGNFLETGNVIPPGLGQGQAGADLFAFYDQNGNQIDVTDNPTIASNPAKMASIATVKINVSLLTSGGAGQTARTSLSATARLEQ